MPTLITIWGDKLAPGLGDQYLAKTGFNSQQTDEPVDGQREGNLFMAVPGDYGAHSPFDGRAHGRSVHLWATTHRDALLIATGTLLAGVWLLRR